MNFNLMDSHLDIKNTPRNLSYKKNSIKDIEDQNEDYIPFDMDEVPNSINSYCLSNIGGSNNTKSKVESPSRKSQRTSSFVCLAGSNTSPLNITRKSQKLYTQQYSFLQLKLLSLQKSSSKLPSIHSLQNLDNNSSSSDQLNEKQSHNMQCSSPLNNLTASCSSQFKRQQEQLAAKGNSHFTEYYRNAIIEYID